MKTKLLSAVAGVLLAVTGMPAIARLSSPSVANAAQNPATDPSKIPHYFGPYPNWVNSPQVMTDAVVTISGGGGSGAEAVATVEPKTGAVTGIDVTVPGSGYSSNPTVTITSPGVTPRTLATATATISTGAIASITVDETGYGFTAPVATLTPQPGHNPTTPATVLASGGVDDVSIASGGSGYKNAPLVIFGLPDVPGGVQATGTATMEGGVITGVSVVDPGSGYTTAPTVTVKDGGAYNETDPAIVHSTINVTQVDVTSGGAGYTGTPTISIMDVVDPAHPANPAIDRYASGTVNVASNGAVTGVTVTNGGAGYLTPGLKKFHDTLPKLGAAGANSLGNYLPVAQADTESYPGSDFYVIAVMQTRHQFSSDMPATLIRTYVQLSTSAVPGTQTPLFNELVDGTKVPIMIDGVQATSVDPPQYLGPTVVAQKNRPVRVLFRNLLPTGSDGDLFIPVDTTLMGSGMGPDATKLDANNIPIDNVTDQGTVTDGVRNPMCGNSPKPATCYTENRSELHLHGGISPWISDGTPHQWITPAGETGTLYPKGVSVQNVPDMPDYGPGTVTMFYTNQQGARLMWYHDHSWGITRLNVYAGLLAAGRHRRQPVRRWRSVL